MCREDKKVQTWQRNTKKIFLYFSGQLTQLFLIPSYNWLLQYKDHKHDYRFQLSVLHFRLYRRRCVEHSVFSLYWCRSETCAQIILSYVIRMSFKVIFGTKYQLYNAVWRNPITLIVREIQITVAISCLNYRLLFTRPKL